LAFLKIRLVRVIVGPLGCFLRANGLAHQCSEKKSKSKRAEERVHGGILQTVEGEY
jgi:hypothetical protein